MEATSCGARLDLDSCMLEIHAGHNLGVIAVLDIEGLLAPVATPPKHCDAILAFTRNAGGKARVYTLVIEAGLHRTEEYLEKLKRCITAAKRLLEELVGGKLSARYRFAAAIATRSTRRHDPFLKHITAMLSTHIPGLTIVACGDTITEDQLLALFRRTPHSI